MSNTKLEYTVCLSDWDNENRIIYHAIANDPQEAATDGVEYALLETEIEMMVTHVFKGWIKCQLNNIESEEQENIQQAQVNKTLTEEEYADIASRLNCANGCTEVGNNKVDTHFEADSFSHFYCGHCGDTTRHILNVIGNS